MAAVIVAPASPHDPRSELPPPSGPAARRCRSSPAAVGRRGHARPSGPPAASTPAIYRRRRLGAVVVAASPSWSSRYLALTGSAR